jgi:hypothetical protein
MTRLIAGLLTGTLVLSWSLSGGAWAQAGGVQPGAAPTTRPDDRGAQRDDDEGGDFTYGETEDASGDYNNIIVVENRSDNRLRMRGHVDLNRIPGSDAEPGNVAIAYSSCTDCQTFAIALQIDLISEDATTIAPQNAAVAVNDQCTRCYTVARALQYVFQVEDLHDLPPRVNQLVNRMNRELRRIQSDRRIGATEAERRIDDVIAEFVDLADRLSDQREERDNEDEGPARTPTVTITPSSTAPLATPLVNASPVPTASATPGPTDVGATAIPLEGSATPTPVDASSTPVGAGTSTPLSEASATPTVIPSSSETPTADPALLTPTVDATSMATATPSITPTPIPG